MGLVRFNDFKLDRELDLILSISRQDFDNAFSAETDGVKRAALYSKMHLTWERLTEKGIPPLDGVVKMAQFLGSRTDIPILGNNVRSFDMPRIMMMCSQLSGKAVSLPMDRVIDLGAMVKAAQMNAKMLPDETPAGFMSRIANIRAKAIYWSIDYMVAQMNLPVQLDILHDAVADCKVLACAVDCFMSGGTLSDDRRSYWRHVIHGD